MAVLSYDRVRKLLVDQVSTQLAQLNVAYATALYDRLLSVHVQLQETANSLQGVAPQWSSEFKEHLRTRFDAIMIVRADGVPIALLGGARSLPDLTVAERARLAKGGTILIDPRSASDRATYFTAETPTGAVFGVTDNLKKKLLLCEKVEALGETDEVDTVKALQAEWKSVGPAPKDQSDEVWNRFRAACDKVFDRRRKAEEAPSPAAAADQSQPQPQPSGISGFTNKLPLANIAAELAAGWSDIAGDDEEKKK